MYGLQVFNKSTYNKPQILEEGSPHVEIYILEINLLILIITNQSNYIDIENMKRSYLLQSKNNHFVRMCNYFTWLSSLFRFVCYLAIIIFITYLHVVVKGYHGEGFVIRQFSVIYFHTKNSCVKVYTIQTFCCHQQPYWQRMTIQQKGAISNVQLRISSYTALRLRQTIIRKSYND